MSASIPVGIQRPVGMHRAMPWLVGAQFAAGVSDQALLIVAVGILIDQGSGFWWAPLLKFGFTSAYVVLAPWVGGWVDGSSKARWMVRTHLVKACAVLALLLGAPPLLAFMVVGCAAAVYAPARYGWVTEVTDDQSLVRANAWLEVGLVGSALLGTVLGGFLLSPAWSATLAALHSGLGNLPRLGFGNFTLPQSAALVLLAACYALATGVNQRVPCSGWHQAAHRVTPARRQTLPDFVQANQSLWGDSYGGKVALAATSLFWGTGAALQIIVLQWATSRLALPLHQAAYLQGVVAIGMIVGAALAGRYVSIGQAHRLLPVGVALGVLVPLAALTTHVGVAAICLALAGAAGGFTVIPLNALLQSRGMALLTPGRSMAVQAFNENASILLMLGLYALLARQQVSATAVMWILGAGVTVGLLSLMHWLRRHPL